MTEQSQAVLSVALQLSLEERAELVAELLVSLDGEPEVEADAEAEAAWAQEIERRARRVLDEGSRGRPWEEVRDELRRRL